MKTVLNQAQLNGTLPVLYVFLARAGYTIEAVEHVASIVPAISRRLAKATRRECGSISAPAAQERRRSTSSPAISPTGRCQSNPGFMNFLEAQGRGLTLLKAASYLMQGPNFDRIRNFLLNNSSVILQDDSGIQFRFFDPNEWIIRYCGRYVAPIDIFKQPAQPALAQAFNSTTPVPLTFGFGYQRQPNRSSLLIAQPRTIGTLLPSEQAYEDEEGDTEQ